MRSLILFCLLAVQQVISKEPNGAKDEMIAQPANITDFPYQVSFFDDGKRVCSGAIVSANYILASGDCCLHAVKPNTVVRAGSSNYKNGTIIPIANVTVHPKYGKTNILTDYDIGCMKTVNPMNFSESIKPIRLAKKARSITGEVLISGWELRREGDPQLDIMKSVKQKVLSDLQCANIWGNLYVENRMWCCGNYSYNANSSDYCQDNSGGPAIQDGALCGLLGFGGRCNDFGPSLVFTSIISTEMRNYIRMITKGTVL